MGLSGHLEEPRFSKLCKDIDERVNAFLDRPARRRMALSVARCDLPQGPRRRAHRMNDDMLSPQLLSIEPPRRDRITAIS
jgi:hypothetical protein